MQLLGTQRLSALDNPTPNHYPITGITGHQQRVEKREWEKPADCIQSSRDLMQQVRDDFAKASIQKCRGKGNALTNQHFIPANAAGKHPDRTEIPAPDTAGRPLTPERAKA